MVTQPIPQSDPLNRSVVSAEDDMRTIMINRISWGAVFAGALIGIVVQIILNLLAVGLGLSAVSATDTGGNPAGSTFSIAAGLWFVVTMLVAAFAGGFFAGRLSGKPVDNTASYHGVMSWAVSTIVIIYLLSSAVGSLVGGATSVLGSVAGGLGQAATTAAKTAAPALANVADPFGGIEQKIRDASGGSDPAALRDAAVTAVRAAMMGDPAQAQDAREKAAQALSKAQNVSIEESRTRVAQYEQQYRDTTEQAKQKAIQATEATRKAVSTAALFAFLALLLGAVVAWFGGRSGTVTPTVDVLKPGRI